MHEREREREREIIVTSSTYEIKIEQQIKYETTFIPLNIYFPVYRFDIQQDEEKIDTRIL
jgi:hypothetical protein